MLDTDLLVPHYVCVFSHNVNFWMTHFPSSLPVNVTSIYSAHLSRAPVSILYRIIGRIIAFLEKESMAINMSKIIVCT